MKIFDLIEHRGLPESIDSERLILGSALMDPELLEAVISTVETEDFALEKHRKIFKRILAMHEAGQAIDRVTIATELHSHGELESVDGLSYLMSLDEGLPRLPHVDAYLRIVRDKATMRRAITAHMNAIQECLSGAGNAGELLGRAESSLRDLQSRVGDEKEFQTPDQVIRETGSLGAFLENRRVDGVRFPWAELNELTRGMQPGSLNILAARTSRGKTAAALQIAAHAASASTHVAYFSFEMDNAECTERLICIAGGVSFREMRSGSDIRRIGAAANSAASLPIHIRDRSATVTGIHSKVRRLAARHPIGLVVVDYLQLASPGGKFENRTQEVSAMSRGLKMAAADLRVPFLVLSQLSRAPGQQGNRRPELHDLRESGSIEQDANCVLFLHSPREFADLDPHLPAEIDLILAKQRNGPIGEVKLSFIRERGIFEPRYSNSEAA